MRIKNSYLDGSQSFLLMGRTFAEVFEHVRVVRTYNVRAMIRVPRFRADLVGSIAVLNLRVVFL